MPRLLVVSRTPALAMGLAGTRFTTVVLSEHEVIESAEPPSVDAILLDLQSADETVRLLTTLRHRFAPIPALVLVSPDWDVTPVQRPPQTSIVVRPVSQPSLVQSLERLLDATQVSPTAPEGAGQVARREPKPTGLSAMTPLDLVRALLPSAGRLPTVAEVSRVVLQQALVENKADAGALMLREENHWWVAAGSGLRPLEARSELSIDHWLVQTVGVGARGVLVTDTDIARQMLAGAPLASWRHLLAIPVPHIGGILILARRNNPPFSEDNIEQSASLGRDAAAFLLEALEVRRLARALIRYTARKAEDR